MVERRCFYFSLFFLLCLFSDDRFNLSSYLCYFSFMFFITRVIFLSHDHLGYYFYHLFRFFYQRIIVIHRVMNLLLSCPFLIAIFPRSLFCELSSLSAFCRRVDNLHPPP
jgi:hypothetical protein